MLCQFHWCKHLAQYVTAGTQNYGRSHRKTFKYIRAWLSDYNPQKTMDVPYTDFAWSILLYRPPVSLKAIAVHPIKMHTVFLCLFPYHCIISFYETIWHYNDVIMSAMASQIISLAIVYSSVYSGVGQRKNQSSASLTFVRGIHRWPVNSPHKRPVTRKCFHLTTSSWYIFP